MGLRVVVSDVGKGLVGLDTGGEIVPLGVPTVVEEMVVDDVVEIEVVAVLDEVGLRVSGARVDGAEGTGPGVVGGEGATGLLVGFDAPFIVGIGVPSGILIA